MANVLGQTNQLPATLPATLTLSPPPSPKLDSGVLLHRVPETCCIPSQARHRHHMAVHLCNHAGRKGSDCREILEGEFPEAGIQLAE